MNRLPQREEDDREEEAIEGDADVESRGYRAIARAAKASLAPTVVASAGVGKPTAAPWQALTSIEIDDEGLWLRGKQRWNQQPSFAVSFVAMAACILPLSVSLTTSHRPAPWMTFANTLGAWIPFSGNIPLRVATRIDWHAVRRLVVDRTRSRAQLVYATPRRWPTWRRRPREIECMVAFAMTPSELDTLVARLTPHLDATARTELAIDDFVPPKIRWRVVGGASIVVVAAFAAVISAAIGLLR